MVRLAARIALATCALVLLAAAPASANHAEAGGGLCQAHTLTCYPECRWEWTGSNAIGQVQGDTGPCEYPIVVEQNTVVDVTGTVTANKGTGWVDPFSTVSVANFPASYPVINAAGTDLDVTSPGGTGIATEVELVNTDGNPVPVRAGVTDDNHAIGLALGLMAGTLVAGVFFRMVLR